MARSIRMHAQFPISRPDVGLVTALFRGLPGESIASKIEALGVPAASAASGLKAQKLEGNLRFAFGWMMATTKRHLAEIGGFEAIAITTPTALKLAIASLQRAIEWNSCGNMSGWCFRTKPSENCCGARYAGPSDCETLARWAIAALPSLSVCLGLCLPRCCT